MVDRGPINTERLFGAAMKNTDNTLFGRTATSNSDSVRCVCFLFFQWSGLLCCVLVPDTLLAFHLLYTLIDCDCLVYPVSQSDQIIISCISLG